MPIYTSNRYRATLASSWCWVSGHQANVSPIFTVLFSLCFCFPPPVERNIWLFSCQMLHNIHQLLANFLCLQLSAGQVVYTGFFRAFLIKKKKSSACCSQKQHCESGEDVCTPSLYLLYKIAACLKIHTTLLYTDSKTFVHHSSFQIF